jgi:hypothetical protein
MTSLLKRVVGIRSPFTRRRCRVGGGDVRFAPVDDFLTSEGLELALFVGTSGGCLFSFLLIADLRWGVEG